MRRLPYFWTAAALLGACAAPSKPQPAGLEPLDGWQGCTLDAPSPPAGQEFELKLGRSVRDSQDTGTYDGHYEPAADGMEVSVVHGPQGGIHLEVAFELTPGQPADHRVWIRGRTYRACDTQDEVGSTRIPGYRVGDSWISEQVQIWFSETQIAPVVGRDCCVVLTVGLREPGQTVPTRFACDTKRFQCKDEVAE